MDGRAIPADHNANSATAIDVNQPSHGSATPTASKVNNAAANRVMTNEPTSVESVRNGHPMVTMLCLLCRQLFLWYSFVGKMLRTVHGISYGMGYFIKRDQRDRDEGKISRVDEGNID